MPIQFDLTRDMKRHILKEHDFFVAQVKSRVFTQFQDMEADANRYAEEEFERLSNRPDTGETDMDSIAEDAHDNAVEYYGLLSDLRQSLILGALAGLYHQWEKQLREFVELELGHNGNRDKAAKKAWGGNIGDTFQLLAAIGWDVREEPFFPLIDACRLIVNVYKHGQGPSLKDLHSKYPDYLKDPLKDWPSEFRERFLHHEWLTLPEGEFEKIAMSIRRFWIAFPVRLFKE